MSLDLVPPIPFSDVLFPASLDPFDCADDFGVLHVLSYVLLHLVESVTINIMIGELNIRNLLSNPFQELFLFN